jgi:hypothetical protein
MKTVANISLLTPRPSTSTTDFAPIRTRGTVIPDKYGEPLAALHAVADDGF